MTNRFSRRRFLQAGSVAALSPLASQILMAHEREPIRKRIPSSGEDLAVIGLGTSRTFNVSPGDAVQSPLLEVMRAFFDKGGQLIDSSPMYGNAEAVTGALVEAVGNPSALFAATKVWTWGKQEGIEQMQQSMQRMGVERFGLMQIHNLRDWEVQLETLREWKAAGKIRHLGITTSHGRFHSELEQILQNHEFDFVQFSYNIENRVAEQRLFPIARERGIATLINRPYQRGSLFRRVKGQALPDWAAQIDCASWGQFFLKYIASHPDVTCIIPATSKVKHMVDNMGAGFGRLPDADLRERMARHVAEL